MENKICLINDSFPPVIDGVANAVVNYAQNLQQWGGAAVVTPFYPEAEDSAYDFPVYRYPSLDTTRQVGYRTGLPFSAELMQKLENSNFQLIHSHCPMVSTVLGRLLRERIHAPLVMTYHTKFDIDIANAIHLRRLQESAAHFLVENISACDEVWTVSRGAGENLRKLGYEGDYVVMPNGVDLPVGRVDAAAVEAVCGDWELPEETPVLLFVGRMMWYKGIRLILDALARLKQEGRDFCMVFLGGGADRDEIVEYAETLGLGSCVRFVPAEHDRERIRAWYCRAQLFLFPSTFDTNGLVVREAAACALASVLIRGSCAAEGIADGRNGFLVEENAEAIAQCLRGLLGNRERLAAVGENAQRELYLSWSEAVKLASERYAVVVENHRRGETVPHERLSDALLGRIAEAMAVRNHLKELALNLRERAEQLHERS